MENFKNDQLSEFLAEFHYLKKLRLVITRDFHVAMNSRCESFQQTETSYFSSRILPFLIVDLPESIVINFFQNLHRMKTA